MSTQYIATIGLEIHAELKTSTKMFCSSKNDANESRANVNVCPVCLAHPGTLPVINGEAVRQVLRVGTALGSKLADYTEFDRKNYFYPDLPKGYQLSQYEFPLVSGGSLGGVEITRIHLEEDTASSIHDERSGSTLIDYNRAGVPLMELVTEPVIHSAQQAGDFGRELQLLLRYLGASDADMEKGQMRLEANVSISASDSLGTKVEIKNINSFRAMERAVEYEIERQSRVLESGEKVVQETRGWDEGKQATFAQRIKEGSADYRYFPDPDLPSLRLSEFKHLEREALRGTLPELPWQRRARYQALEMRKDDIELYIRHQKLGDFFDQVVKIVSSDKERVRLSANYITNDLVNILRGDEKGELNIQSIPISASNFAKLIELLATKRISSRSAKDILAECAESDSNPEIIAKEKNLFQEAVPLEAVVLKVIAENPTVVSDFKAGKAPALEFLVGQSMKALRGAADPVALRELIRKSII